MSRREGLQRAVGEGALEGSDAGEQGVELGGAEADLHEVVGAAVMSDSTEPLIVENAKGKQFEITVWRTVVQRGGKGQQLFKRGTLERQVPHEPIVPELSGGE